MSDTIGAGFASGYTAGNMERWGFIISSYLPHAWTLLTKTIDPIVYAALIELLGSNSQFSKKFGNMTPIIDNDKYLTGFAVTLKYSVPEFIGYDGNPKAEEQDRAYLLGKLQTIPNIEWKQSSVALNIREGMITIQFIMPVGY